MGVMSIYSFLTAHQDIGSVGRLCRTNVVRLQEAKTVQYFLL